VASIKLVIESGKAVIVVFRFQGIEILRRYSQRCLRRIDQPDIVEKYGWVCWRLAASLSFIVHEEESLVFRDGAAERGAELVLAQDIRLRLGLQK
jgi:hypothetical protein